jgi:effector-binding domain-containing protein
MRLRFLSFLFLSFTLSSMAIEQAFVPTDPGITELKILPSGTLLKASSQGNYFDQSGRLFRPLFNYISANDIKMTVPVEAEIDGAAMYFWVGREELAKVRESDSVVSVVRLPERQVASRGARGAYSQKNFNETRDALLDWVNGRGDLEATGPAYAVYWNGPFTPWFLKQFEVHIPIRFKQ